MPRLLLALLLIACAPESVDIGTDTDPITDTDTDTDVADLHPCERAKLDAFNRGPQYAWGPDHVEACYEGCSDAEDGAGYDQGRLSCILGGEFCPRCIGDLGGADAFYTLGYTECFEVVYTAGHTDAGCPVPD